MFQKGAQNNLSYLKYKLNYTFGALKQEKHFRIIQNQIL